MKTTTRIVAVSTLCVLAGAAHAHLGGFEKVDGYEPFLNLVQNYNAGQYGVNSGYMAMAPVAITPGTGLWHALNGGFSSGGAISYATGHQWYDRTWVNSGGTSGQLDDQALVLTTGHEGLAGPALRYRYDLDAQDLGVAPSMTSGAVVRMDFWARGFLDSGLVGPGYFGNQVLLEDSTGNVGFRLGLTKTSGGDMVTFWNGTSMQVSSVQGGSSTYDQWRIVLDLANDTVSASYFQFSTGITHIFATGVPMQSTMNDFSHLTFSTTPGLNNAKFSSVDDFEFHTRIPAPAGGVAMALGMVAAGRRRR
jgi:hypothetical protein